jgi:hypothetical protein
MQASAMMEVQIAVVFGANGLLVYGTTGYQFDPQGNATHLLNNNGSAIAHHAYDAWGQRMSGSNPTPCADEGQWGYCKDRNGLTASRIVNR